jgi:plasmid stabilization system protein ParE
VSLALRWTEQATNQLGAIAEYISLASPVYAEQMVERIVTPLRQAQEFPESGRQVPELASPDVRELVEAPCRIIYRATPSAIEVITSVHGRQDLRPPRQS